jgi:hypothetical protein
MVGLAGCGRRDVVCGRRADHSVVACFDGQPITAAEVGEHVRPVEMSNGSTAIVAPQAAALKAALRVRMFAAEAARRELAPGDGRDARSRAVLHQAMVHDEIARMISTPDDVTLDEARARYAERPGEVNKITGTWVRAIFIDGSSAAEAAFDEVVGLDDAGFAAAAQRLSTDTSAANGGDLGEAHADGIDPIVRRAANDLRAEGDTRGPVPLGGDRWVILRATKLEVAERPFGDAERDVRHAIAKRREIAALNGLYMVLERQHEVVIFEDELARVPGPP